MKSVHRHKILKAHNLILAQIINYDDEIHESIQKLCDQVAADKDYHHGMNFIADMKKPIYPEDEFYYNDMARTLNVKIRVIKFIRIICPEDKKLKRNYRVFLIFTGDGGKVAGETVFVDNLSDAIKAANLPDDKDLIKEIEDFYIYYNK